jgi:hypothetical protein
MCCPESMVPFVPGIGWMTYLIPAIFFYPEFCNMRKLLSKSINKSQFKAGIGIESVVYEEEVL